MSRTKTQLDVVVVDVVVVAGGLHRGCCNGGCRCRATPLAGGYHGCGYGAGGLLWKEPLPSPLAPIEAPLAATGRVMHGRFHWSRRGNGRRQERHSGPLESHIDTESPT